ncbi:MAG: DUF6143 family protein [Eubacteriales bacterium]
MDSDAILIEVKKQKEVVCIPNPLSKSIKGQYFVGQTETLILSQDLNAWGGLINPSDSGVNLFVNVYTVTNFSETPFLAQIWFNTEPPGKGVVSDEVSPGNTTLSPLPVPKIELQYVQSVGGFPTGGVNVLDRLVGPKGTLASEDDGKWIIPPGGNFIVFLESPGAELIKAIIAFGWWQEKIKTEDM